MRFIRYVQTFRRVVHTQFKVWNILGFQRRTEKSNCSPSRRRKQGLEMRVVQNDVPLVCAGPLKTIQRLVPCVGRWTLTTCDGPNTHQLEWTPSVCTVAGPSWRQAIPDRLWSISPPHIHPLQDALFFFASVCVCACVCGSPHAHIFMSISLSSVMLNYPSCTGNPIRLAQQANRGK